MRVLKLRLLAIALILLGTQLPAYAADDGVRPSGYIERGHLEGSGASLRFVPDSDTGRDDGRYFRVGGYDNMVIYGLGSDPLEDWLWPDYHVQSALKDLLSASPAGASELETYGDAQQTPQFLARTGWLALWGAVAAAAGGEIYDRLPGNPYEMQPSYYYTVGGTALAGFVLWGLSTWACDHNYGLLDAALVRYNRELAGHRHLILTPDASP